MNRNLVYEAIGELRLVVSCQNRDFPTDAEWDGWLVAAESVERTAKEFRLLVVTEGGHPTKQQLERLRAAKQSNPATSIVSPNRAYRFMATALTFINPTIRCFPPAEYDRAFEHIALVRPERERVRGIVERLNRQLTGASSAV